MDTQSFIVELIITIIVKIVTGCYDYWWCVEPDPSYGQILSSYIFWSQIPTVCPTVEAIVLSKVKETIAWTFLQICSKLAVAYVRLNHPRAFLWGNNG